MPVIDVHTHMFSQEYFDILMNEGAPRYSKRIGVDGRTEILSEGARFLMPQPGHFDYDIRIAAMDKAGVDIAIVTLTAPNCFFGTPEVSLRAARVVNDDMARAQKDHPDRIRWMVSVPWEYPDMAVAELERGVANGAVGVMVLANINGRSLTDPAFAPVWKAIDDHGLPVLVHPTTPPGYEAMDLEEHSLTGSIGFMFDTSLAIGRMIFDGFFDTYPNLKIIASHAGGALPYFIGRLDRCFEMDPARRKKISRPPSTYMSQIYYDAIAYRQEALQMCIDVGGEDNVMYGSDYPHTIGDMAGVLGRVNALSASCREKVKGENARRIFRL